MHCKTTKALLSRILLTILSAMSFWSCDAIYDDLSDCHMYIRFKYDYNMDKTDKFAEQCDKVEVFLFDADGVLVRTITDSGENLKKAGYRIEIPIHSGDYTVMAWVGRKDSYDLTDMTVGTSTKDDLILRLRSTANTHDGELEPLWSGTPVDFTYTGSSHHTETIDLVKNTNRVNLQVDMDADLEVKITGANGSYLYDNGFADTQTIAYLPFSTTTATGQSGFSFSSLRFVEGHDVRLSVIDKTTGKSLLPAGDWDLIAYLLKTKPEGMTDQEYLDRQDTWNIALHIDGYIAMSIEINGWVVWTQDSELGKL